MSDLLFDKYSKLPKEIQGQVIDFIDFLMLKHQKKYSIESSRKKKSNFGSAKGLITMSDDFDSPLDKDRKFF